MGSTTGESGGFSRPPGSSPSRCRLPGVGEPGGYAVTRLGKHTYGFDVVEKVDPRGRKYYWIGGNEYQHEDIAGSDCNAVLRDGLVSVTPLQLDLTDDTLRPVVASWMLEGYRRP